MKWRRLVLCAWLVAIGGCDGCGDEPPPAARVRDEPAPSAAEAASGPAPDLRVRATPGDGPEVALVVENHAAEVARLRAALLVERKEGEAFRRMESIELSLRYDCEAAPPECVELAPGAAFHPPPWLGAAGSAQCACEGCEAVPAGTYRVIAQSCDGAHRFESEAVER